MAEPPLILRIPEILIQILEWVPVLHPADASTNVLALTQVCYQWRAAVHKSRRMWQIISLHCTLTYDNNHDAKRPFFRSNVEGQVKILTLFVVRSQHLPLAIRFVLPSLQHCPELAADEKAMMHLIRLLWYFLAIFSDVNDRIDQVTFIAPDQQSMDFVSCILNNPESVACFDSSQLFRNVRFAQFLYVNDVVAEMPFQPIPEVLPKSITELVLIRPLHQWWQAFCEGPDRARLSQTTSLIFQRALIRHANLAMHIHLIDLFSIVSGPLRYLELRDDTPLYDDQSQALWEHLYSGPLVEMRLEEIKFVCTGGRRYWFDLLVDAMKFCSKGQYRVSEHGDDREATGPIMEL